VRLQTRLGHGWLALRLLPTLLVNGQQRHLLQQMRGFVQRLPQTMAQPLPLALQQLLPGEDVEENGRFPPAHTLRQLADLAALLERRSPLGICLRRSLVRFHYLRQVSVPLVVQFGARFDDQTAQRQVAGHAWTTLNGKPYYEADENWQNFVVMFQWPDFRAE
jgi:hypothetical protein